MCGYQRCMNMWSRYNQRSYPHVHTLEYAGSMNMWIGMMYECRIIANTPTYIIIYCSYPIIIISHISMDLNVGL